MKYVNAVTVAGDVKEITIKNNNRVNMVIATYWSHKNKFGDLQDTEVLHNVVCYSRVGSGVIEQEIRKGDRIIVYGRVKATEYPGQYGASTANTEIVCNHLGLMGSRASNNPQYIDGQESQVDKFNSRYG